MDLPQQTAKYAFIIKSFQITLTQPNAIKEELQSNFLSGISILKNYKSISNNTRYVFHYYDLQTNLQAVNVYNEKHLSSLIDQEDFDSVPDPNKCIVWIDYFASEHKAQAHKEHYEESTKTHFTTQENGESPVNNKGGYGNDKHSGGGQFKKLKNFLEYSKYSSVHGKTEQKSSIFLYG